MDIVELKVNDSSTTKPYFFGYIPVTMRTLLIICLICFPWTAEAATWKVGLGKVDITPQDPIRQGGYAARNKPSEGIRTPLWVKALMVTDAKGKKAVLITADIIRYPRFISDSIRNELLRRYKLEKSQIILNGSHTHSGPEINVHNLQYMATAEELKKVAEFSGILYKATLQAVDAAMKNPFEAKIWSGSGIARFAVNRRNNKESEILNLAELKGPFDHSVPVLKIVDQSNSVRAFVFGYACHPTVLSDYLISGDYPAYAQMSLEKKFPGAQAMFFIGAAGDQNPLPRRSVPLAIKYGEELALAVEAACNSPMTELEPTLNYSYREIDLPYEKAPPSRAELEKVASDTLTHPNWIVNQARVLLDRLSRGEKLPGSYPYPVQIWQMGKQVIVTLGGEIVVEYALAVKKRLGPQTIVMGYSNDLMAYIPSRKVLQEGGYEGSRSPLFTTPWHQAIESNIIEEVVRQARSLGISAL